MAAKKSTTVKKKAGPATRKAVKKGSASKTASPAKKKAAKPTAKKSAAKKKEAKPVAKKTAAKKSAPKKASPPAKKKSPAKGKSTTSKKSAPKKGSLKKSTAKKSAPKKSGAKKPVARKASSPKKDSTKSPSKPPVRRPPVEHAPSVSQARGSKSKSVKKLTATELKKYRKALLDLRDQVVDVITFHSGDNLNRSQRDATGDLSSYSLHMADQGTDNYDREFALNLVSTEQDALYEIDEAVRRVDAGTFGICELSGEPIERARLDVIPFARYSVAAQSEIERGRTKYRPFGTTLSH